MTPAQELVTFTRPPAVEPGPLLPVSFFARDALVVARELVGAELRQGPILLRITEAEAYRWPDDTACHARAGRTRRNAPMWGPPGRAYVYLCYGLHWMLNVVTQAEGEASAVLIRGCEPLEGLPELQARRGARMGPDLLRGPGRLGAALRLDASWNHHPLHEPGGLELRAGKAPEGLLVGPRVGIAYAEPHDREAPWRFALAGSAWVSHRRTLRSEDEASGQRTESTRPARHRRSPG